MQTLPEGLVKVVEKERDEGWSPDGHIALDIGAETAKDYYEPMIRHLIEAGDALVRGRRKQGWGRRQKELTDEELHWVKSVAEIEEEIK